MPWENNTYKVSVYTKDELPTWNELYNEFYVGKYWDPLVGLNTEKWTEYEPYWDIPKWKYLDALACNQINKTIHEDKLFPQYSDYIMMCSEYEWHSSLYWHERFPIYHINHPKGLKDPFIIENPKVIRICVNNTNFNLIRFVKYNGSQIMYGDDEFDDMLEDLMQPYIDYFENGVGWKDENGNLIQSKPSSNVCKAGYDPAL